MSEEFEFDESELYGEPDSAQVEQESDADEQAELSGEENELDLSNADAEEDGNDGAENPSDGPGSAASGSTHLEVPTENGLHTANGIAASVPRLPPSARRTTSLPESNVKLGASVPINIPFMSSWRNEFPDSGAQLAMPQTFVPPHQLSSRAEDPIFSLQSGSYMSANAKRDRLRQRNQILQRTGFLEVEKSEASEDGSQQLPTVQSGGLTAAFGARNAGPYGPFYGP